MDPITHVLDGAPRPQTHWVAQVGRGAPLLRVYPDQAEGGPYARNQARGGGVVFGEPEAETEGEGAGDDGGVGLTGEGVDVLERDAVGFVVDV
jgi:hypothetical protein